MLTTSKGGGPPPPGMESGRKNMYVFQAALVFFLCVPPYSPVAVL